MYLVYTRYIPDIYFGVYVGIYQVYTRYIPGLEITRYIPGIYLVYTSYIADIGLYPVYTRYIPGKFHFYRFQMYDIVGHIVPTIFLNIVGHDIVCTTYDVVGRTS